MRQRYTHYLDDATFDVVKLAADLGGYLGLMLGYSAYSFADLLEYLWRVRKEREKQKAMDMA